MAVSSSVKEWINRQTAMEKLSIGLVWLTLPDVTNYYGLFKFVGTVILTAWIWHRQLDHKEKMTNLD